MSTTRLPELPTIPTTHIMLLSDLQSGTEPGFNRWHMEQYAHAYGLAVWKAAIEAAAKECERHTLKWDGPFSRAAADCANAIRSLPDPSATPQDQGGER